MTARYLSYVFPYSLVVLLAYQCAHLLNLATLAPTMACMVVILCVAGLAAFRQIPEHRFTASAVIGTAAITGLYLLTCNEWVHVIGDNIVYIRDAMRLVQGRGVVDSQYGLGVKTLLMPAVVLFPDSVLALKATIALTGFLFPLFTFLVAREFIDNSRALLIALITGSSWLSMEYSNVATADVPFPAFSMLALWAILKYIKHPGISWKWLIAASCAAGWAYHVKSPSVYLVIAAAIYLVLRGQFRKPALLAACVSVWVLPWVLYLKVNFPETQGYLGMIHQISAGVYIPEGEVGSFWDNFFYYFFTKNPRGYLENLEYLLLFRQFLDKLPITAAWRPMGWLFFILIGIGFVFGRKSPARKPLSLLRSLEVHDWYFMGYVATLFALPGSPARYLLPVLPFIVLYVFNAAERICGLFPESTDPAGRRARFLRLSRFTPVLARPVLIRYAPVFLACLFLLPSLYGGFAIVRGQRTMSGYHTVWKPYYEASVWMRDNTPPESRVSTRKPGLVWFWSKRETDGYPRSEDPAEAMKALDKFDYVLLENIPAFKEKLTRIMPAIKAYPERFSVVHIAKPPETYVIKINKKAP